MLPGRPIRLFVDAHVFDNEYQGTRTYIKELYSRLVQKPGIEFYFGAADTRNLSNHLPVAPNVHFVNYPGKASVARLLLHLPSLLEKHNIDLAHFQYIVPPRKKCSYLVTIHDVIFEEYPAEFSYRYRVSKKILYRHAARKADILTTVSAYSKESITRHLNIDPQKISIVPNAVSDQYFEPYDKVLIRNQMKAHYGLGRFILYVSRIEPRKNHERLLRSYLDLELHKQGIQLVFLGHKSLPVPGLEKLVNSLASEVKKYIIWKNDIDDCELLNFYRACEVFVYPSRAEGFGISPLEAAACNAPVICSNSSAMSAFSFFGENHIDPVHQEKLNERLHAMIFNPPSQEGLNKIAAMVRRDYSWDNASDMLYDLIINHFNSLSKTCLSNDKLQLS